jgi:hypothetical protein
VARPLPPPPDGARRRWWQPQRIAGVTLAAAGVGLAIASIPLFVIDGACSSDGDCLFRRDASAAKYGLLASGLALAATGAILIAAAPRARIAVAPALSISGAGLIGAVRF